MVVQVESLAIRAEYHPILIRMESGYRILVMSIESCPVVYPTWAQFNDFLGYTEQLERAYSQKYGMVKVRSPPLRSCPPRDGRPARRATRAWTR